VFRIAKSAKHRNIKCGCVRTNIFLETSFTYDLFIERSATLRDSLYIGNKQSHTSSRILYLVLTEKNAEIVHVYATSTR